MKYILLLAVVIILNHLMMETKSFINKGRKSMKKKSLLILPLLAVTLLAGCGDSGYYESPAMSSSSDSASPKGILVADDSSYATGGNYSGTTMSGDYADYSYSFAANGETHKTKEDMLDYYESLQKLVNESGGYIENINNRYNGYVIAADDRYISDTEVQYEATGSLSFTIQIPNEQIPLITDNLENFCVENRFVVTTYNQKITNYEGYEIVNSYDQDKYSDSQVITKKELETKLKYASLSVDINYRIRRPGFDRFVLGVKKNWNNFINGVGEVVLAFLVVAVGVIVFFVEAIIFYKLWKKMIFKHRMKRPEYYPARHVVLDNSPEARADISE